MTKWKCNKCGHEWVTEGNSYDKPLICPTCAVGLYHLKCTGCNHEWDTPRSRKTECPSCNGGVDNIEGGDYNLVQIKQDD